MLVPEGAEPARILTPTAELWATSWCPAGRGAWCCLTKIKKGSLRPPAFAD